MILGALVQPHIWETCRRGYTTPIFLISIASGKWRQWSNMVEVSSGLVQVFWLTGTSRPVTVMPRMFPRASLIQGHWAGKRGEDPPQHRRPTLRIWSETALVPTEDKNFHAVCTSVGMIFAISISEFHSY